MKLSEAIRVGAKIRPQGFGNLYETRETTERVGWFRKRVKREKRSCVLGAALEAADCKPHDLQSGESRGISPRGSVNEDAKIEAITVPNDWPIFLHVDCPQCEDFEPAPPLIRLMAHLNDDHRWTREQIAVFVERIENAVAQQPQEDATEAAEEWPETISAQ